MIKILWTDIFSPCALKLPQMNKLNKRLSIASITLYFLLHAHSFMMQASFKNIFTRKNVHFGRSCYNIGSERKDLGMTLQTFWRTINRCRQFVVWFCICKLVLVLMRRPKQTSIGVPVLNEICLNIGIRRYIILQYFSTLLNIFYFLTAYHLHFRWL